jgi:hypothetical protein
MLTEAQAQELIELTLRADGAEEDLDWATEHPFHNLWSWFRRGWKRASFERRLAWVGMGWGALLAALWIVTVTA